MTRGSPLLFVFAALAGCGGPAGPAPAEILAASAYLAVGDLILAVPVVAVHKVSEPRPYDNGAFTPHDEDVGPEHAVRLAETGRTPDDPVRGGMLDLSADRFSIGPGRCALFDRTWSRRLCEKGRGAGSLKNLPDRLALVDRRYLSQFDSHYTVGGEKVSDQIARMGELGPAPKLACDEASKFCKAAMAVSPQVVAVWTVWSGSASDEQADQMAARQAPAILAWVRTDLSVRK